MKNKISKRTLGNKKKKSKRKISKIKFLNRNPSMFIKEHLKKLARLIDQDVTLLILNELGTNVGRKLYGVLKLSINNKWIFQFNPLNQWRYEKREKEKQEKVQPIKKTSRDPEFIDYGNEFDQHLLAEEEFLNNEPTLQFEFLNSDIDQVVKNKILLNYFEPKFEEIS